MTDVEAGADRASVAERRPRNGSSRSWLRYGLPLGVAAVVGLALVPSMATGYVISFMMTILMYVALAYSWNVISGYTGYVSFGNIVFFGIGGYASAIAIIKLGMYWLLAALLGGLVAALVAVLLGAIMLRLREAYFAIGMLGVAWIGQIIAQLWAPLTGGGAGLHLPPAFSLEGVYYAFLGLAIACVVGTFLLERTVFGLRLMAIREDELAAEAHGINTTIHKIVAFTISGLIGGVAGGINVWNISYTDPVSAFQPVVNVTMIMMVLFGGPGTVLGPLIGAVALGAVSEWLWATYPTLYLALFGLLLIAIVLIIPNGVVPFFNQRMRARVSLRDKVLGQQASATASEPGS